MSILRIQICRLVLPGLFLALAGPALAQVADHQRELEGVVRSAESGEPLAGAAVILLGVNRSAVTHGDGSFHVQGVGPGEYVVRVERLGFRTATLEIRVTGEGVTRLDVALEPAPLNLQGMVVTGSVTERSADEVLRPVNVLNGEELQRRLQSTVASTLTSQPGVSAMSMGPATSRPVIRGLSGDRVLLLEDGARVGDVSNSGPDHATALDPASARRIEVVRGPAAILYGSNALGGVVNVIRDEIPTEIPHHFTGSFTAQGQSVNEGLALAAHARTALSDHVPLRLEISGRTTGDLATPAGPLENTSQENWSVSLGSGWIGTRGRAGGSVRLYRNQYGIPGGFVGGHAQGVNVKMERASARVEGSWQPGAGPFQELLARGGYTWYEHREIEPPDILGTLFRRQTATGEVRARHDEWGPFTGGAMGLRASAEDFAFGGALFTPDTRRHSLAVFTFQEVDLDPFRLELGLRYDWAETDPRVDDADSDIGVIRNRVFDAASGSLGVMYRVGGGLTLGVNAARAFRTPDVNELYSEGPHLAAYAFEVGNPGLGTEVGTGVDVFARLGHERLNAEVTFFHNDISGFVYPRETGDTSRVRLPIYQFRGEDAVLTGWEAGVEWAVAGALKLDGSASYVRGTLSDTDEPLPLIPPIQARLGLALEPTDWFLRLEGRWAGDQDRLGAFETPTDGYAVFGLSGGLRFTLGGRLHVLTAGVENLTNREYRNHLSRVKEIMPEAGRGLSLTYRVVF